MKLNNKNKILLIFTLLSFIIVYKLAISKTLSYYNSYSDLNEELVEIHNNGNQENILQSRNKNLEKILNKLNYNNNSTNQQNNLLKLIGEEASKSNLKIVAFDEPKILIENKSKVTHYHFSVEGNFNKTLLLLNNLENNPLIGVIKHFSTLKKKDYKNNSNFIITNVVIEKKELL